MARKLIVEIVGDSKSYERALGRSEKATKSFGTSMTGMRRSATLGFGTILKGAGAFVGISAAFNAMGSALRSGISEFSEMQKVAAQTNAVLKSTRGGANVTAADVDALATSLSQLSGVDDEVIASAENLILTFRNVRNETGEGNRIFDRATLAALDLSKAAGGAFGDLPTTAKQLAKALNDPVRGMTALGRAGVTFSTAQKEVIKRLVETGDMLGAQKIILREVERQVGGSAKAYGETLPGQLSKLRESFRNTFGEIIAAAVPPLRQELLPVLQQAAAAIRKWAGDSENQARIQQRVRQAIEAVVAVAKTFKGIFDAVAPVIERVGKAIGGTEQAVKLMVGAMATAKIYGFVTALSLMSTTAATGTTKVNALRLALLRLRALGPIAILVTVVVFRKQINEAGKNVNRWLNEALPGSPFGGNVLNIPIDFTVANLGKLRAARAEMARIRGEDDARVVVLDRIIARLQEIEKTRTAKIKIEIIAPGEGGFRRGEGGGFTPQIRSTVVDEAAGDAAIAAATAAAAQKSYNQQLSESETRAAHLADLIRADPSNLKLQQRYTAELVKQQGLREDIASAARDEAQATRENAEAAREAARQAKIAAQEKKKQIAENKRTATKTAQFAALGLTPEGQRPTPGAGSLLKRATTLQDSIKGTTLDTKKNRSQLQTIVKFLKKNFNKAGKDVRQAILDMLNTIAGAGTDADKTGPLTKQSGLNTKKFLEGLGLTPEQEREARGRLSSIGAGGQGLARPGGGTATTAARGFGGGLGQALLVESHTTINLDGQQVANVVTKQQQRGRRRNPQQKRGPHRYGM